MDGQFRRLAKQLFAHHIFVPIADILRQHFQVLLDGAPLIERLIEPVIECCLVGIAAPHLRDERQRRHMAHGHARLHRIHFENGF